MTSETKDYWCPLPNHGHHPEPECPKCQQVTDRLANERITRATSAPLTSKEQLYQEAFGLLRRAQYLLQEACAKHKRAVAAGSGDETPAGHLTDPAICGEDGPITPDQCALWLDAKYRRHGELEDRAAAMWLRKLSAKHSAVETSPPLTVDNICSCEKRMGEHPTVPPWWPCMVRSPEKASDERGLECGDCGSHSIIEIEIEQPEKASLTPKCPDCGRDLLDPHSCTV